MSDVRVRFAPSPTGYLHIGGLRTALYDYLFAKGKGGKYILRIEDTDRTRLVEGSIKNLIESLLWSGIEHDEGVFIEDGKIVQRGEYGPYIQSERLDIYKEYIDKLIEKGHAYYCFCDKQRLDEVRKKQKAQGVTPKYDGHCRSLSLKEAKERIEAGEKYTIRLKLPENKDITFHDVIRGDITINTNDIDDQVLMKSDGFPTYHFAVVIDDYLMKITHIIRGEEWLTSTPKHVFLYKAFGWEQPEYIHLPTVLNKNKKKLSKRQGDVAVGDYRNKGYLPEALVNYLALVGWSPEGNKEMFTMEELIEEFSLERVSKTGGVFDIDKLNWINGHYIRECSLDRLTKLSIPYLIKAGLITEKDVQNRYEWITKMVSAVQERLSYIGEIADKVEVFFKDEIIIDDEEALEMLKGEQVPLLLNTFKQKLLEINEINEEFAKGIFKKIQKETKIKGKNLYMPTRVMLTGQLHGPDMVNILMVLGKEKVIKRIEYVENKIL